MKVEEVVLMSHTLVYSGHMKSFSWLKSLKIFACSYHMAKVFIAKEIKIKNYSGTNTSTRVDCSTCPCTHHFIFLYYMVPIVEVATIYVYTSYAGIPTTRGKESDICLLDVTEQCHTPQDPVVRIGCMAGGGGCAQRHHCDVCEVCATRLLVHWTHVQLGILHMFS